MNQHPFYISDYLDTDSIKKLAYSDRPLHITLTNDFAFKKTFRNKKALTGLLTHIEQFNKKIKELNCLVSSLSAKAIIQ